MAQKSSGRFCSEALRTPLAKSSSHAIAS